MSGGDSPKPGSSRSADDGTDGACGGPSAEKETLLSIVSQDLKAGAVLVTPLEWCPHLGEHVTAPAPAKVDLKTPCGSCANEGENWLCLRCHEVFCSRYVNEHMLFHGLEKTHLLSISFSDLSVWCYGCEDYVDNEVLVPFKDLLHRAKFDAPYPVPEKREPDGMVLRLQ